MSSNTKITHFLKEQMVLVTCEIASDTCSKPCCSDCSYWSICTLFIKQNLMHQKTVSPIISLKLKERECPLLHLFLLGLNAKKGLGAQTKEKNAILLLLIVMRMLLKMANECTEISASFKMSQPQHSHAAF